jgi:hypothetical protein
VNGPALDPTVLQVTALASWDKSVYVKVYLESLWTGGGRRKAQDTGGDKFPGNIADVITVELHNAADYSIIEFVQSGVFLNTDGNTSFQINGQYNGTYYVTIRHRNSIPVVSANPISFAGVNISYDFTSSATQVFGSNVKDSGAGFLIYAGDVNQDGYVGILDMLMIDNKSAAFATGYLPEDIDGNGCVCVPDMSIIDNNSASFVSSITP